jgi:hypothetical protein
VTPVEQELPKTRLPDEIRVIDILPTKFPEFEKVARPATV